MGVFQWESGVNAYPLYFYFYLYSLLLLVSPTYFTFNSCFSFITKKPKNTQMSAIVSLLGLSDSLHTQWHYSLDFSTDVTSFLSHWPTVGLCLKALHEIFFLNKCIDSKKGGVSQYFYRLYYIFTLISTSLNC